MKKIVADERLNFIELNEEIRQSSESEIIIENCIGQRYIGSGQSDKKITIYGTPGNALGAYLFGSEIEVFGNVQDATGDTMDKGEIIVHGNCGDALGYAMRGGKIFIKGNAGYRVGIHMKEYKEHKPLIVIGGRVGSFLGEYQAGGRIIVLGLNDDEKTLTGNYCATGMHGGEIYLRSKNIPKDLPSNVRTIKCGEKEMSQIKDALLEFCNKFGYNIKEICNGDFYLLKPDEKNPYRQMYTQN